MKVYLIAYPDTLVSLHTVGKLPDNHAEKKICLYQTYRECFESSDYISSSKFVLEADFMEDPLPVEIAAVKNNKGEKWFEVEHFDPKRLTSMSATNQNSLRVALRILNNKTHLTTHIVPEFTQPSWIKPYNCSPPTLLPPPAIYGKVRYMKKGDLLGSRMQTHVNTVNCVGVMGKGIALSFKKRYPRMFEEYKRRCLKGEVKPGVPYLFKTGETRISEGEAVEIFILNFPTKDHWRQPAKIEYIEKGLQLLAKIVEAENITSLAVPPLGCGNGGLQWRDVQPLITKYLEPLEIPVEVYAPFDAQIPN